jgi:hypothetical protein
MEQGMADANFTTQKGNNAVGQYPKFLQDTDERRKKFREGLPNDETRRMFDNRTMAIMGRSVRSASSHMGVEQKNAYITSLDADVKSWEREVSNHPFDEELMGRARDGLRDSIRKKNDALGNERNVAEVEIAEGMESLLAKKLVAASSERPFETWDAFQELKGQLKGTTRDQVEHTLLDNMRSSGSRGAADRVTTDLRTGKPDDKYTIDQRVEDAMKDLPPQVKDDPQMRKNIRDRIEGSFRDIAQQRQITRYQNTNMMYRILSGDESGGALPKDEDAFKAHPQGKLIWDSEDDIGKQKIRDAIRLANTRALQVDPILSDMNRRTWLGTAAANPAEFFEKMQDPTVLYGKMNREDRNFIRGLYEKMLKSPQANPNVTKAMTWLKDANGNTLVELGVDHLKRGQNDEDYYNFRGGILLTLEEWSAAHKGQMPTREQFDKEIAPNILKWKPQSWTNWLTFGAVGEPGEEPFWKDAKVPEDWDRNRRHEIALDKGIDPDSIPKEQIAKDYLQHLYRESIKPKAKPK